MDLGLEDLVLPREDELLEGLSAATGQNRESSGSQVLKTEEGIIKPATVGLLETYQQHLEAFRAERSKDRCLAAKVNVDIQCEHSSGVIAVPASLPVVLHMLISLQKLKTVAKTIEEEARGSAKQGRALAEETAKQERLEPFMSADTCSKAVPSGEAVIHVAVEVPGAGGLISEEWVLLASQSLRDLHKRIFCLSDVNVRAVAEAENARLSQSHRDTGQRPTSVHLQVDLFQKPCYFYVEGTFYTDTSAADLSELVRQHLV